MFSTQHHRDRFLPADACGFRSSGLANTVCAPPQSGHEVLNDTLSVFAVAWGNIEEIRSEGGSKSSAKPHFLHDWTRQSARSCRYFSVTSMGYRAPAGIINWICWPNRTVCNWMGCWRTLPAKDFPITTGHLDRNHLRPPRGQAGTAFMDDDQQFIGVIGKKSPFQFRMRMPILNLDPMCYHLE